MSAEELTKEIKNSLSEYDKGCKGTVFDEDFALQGQLLRRKVGEVIKNFEKGDKK